MTAYSLPARHYVAIAIAFVDDAGNPAEVDGNVDCVFRDSFAYAWTTHVYKIAGASPL